MGRYEHLKRLALGRSAYQDVEAVGVGINNASQNEAASTQDQVHDSKGRASNPSKEQLSAELRQAQNEVLSVVGVLERNRDVAAHVQKQRIKAIHGLHAQYEQVKLIAMFSDLLSLLFTWYPHTLLMRCLAGLEEADVSLTTLMLKDFRPLNNASVVRAWQILFPALGFRLVYNKLSNVYDGVIVRKLEPRLAYLISDVDPRAARSARVASSVFRATTQAYLLPLLQLAVCNQIGILDWRHGSDGWTFDASLLSAQMDYIATANVLTWQGWLAICLLPLTGAFSAGSLSIGMATQHQKIAPTLVNSLLESQTNPMLRARSAFPLFPYCVGLLSDVRTRLMAWRSCRNANQASWQSSRINMDYADVAYSVAVSTPPGHIRQHDSTAQHNPFEPTLLARIPVLRFISLIDAILLKLVQLPIEILILHHSARLFGPGASSLSTSKDEYLMELIRSSSDPQHLKRPLAAVTVNTISRAALAFGLVILTESMVYGVTWLAVKLRVIDGLFGYVGRPVKHSADDDQVEIMD